jgi:hypothetical protein
MFEEVDGYEIIIKNNRCSIYYNGIFYAHCPLVNGLYVLNLEDKSVCNINTKRARLNDLNSTFIWHCRFGHINEKHIERLHKDGVTEPPHKSGIHLPRSYQEILDEARISKHNT